MGAGELPSPAGWKGIQERDQCTEGRAQVNPVNWVCHRTPAVTTASVSVPSRWL